MVADDRFEMWLAERLHGELDAAIGPHPMWMSSPVARRIAERPSGPITRGTLGRRRAIALLVAAALLVVASAILVLGGGGPPSTAPLAVDVSEAAATPSPAALTAEASPLPTAVPSPSPSAVALATPSSPAPCLLSWSHSGSGSAPPSNSDQMNLEYLYNGDGGIYVDLSEPVAVLKHVAIEPVVGPFHDAEGRVVKVVGSAFLRLSISGLKYDQSPLYEPNSAHPGPGTFGVEPPVTGIHKIRPSGVTHVWIIGLDYPVCLAPSTRWSDMNGSHPTSDNVIFIGFTPKLT